MKILRVIASMDPSKGGPCEGIRNSIPEMLKSGVQNEVVSLDDPSSPFLSREFKIHALGPAKGPWCYSSKLLPWLRQNIMQYDVIIVHGLWLYHGFAVRKTMNRLRKKSVAEKTDAVLPRVYVMPHGMLDPYFQKARGRKLKALRNQIYWKLIESKLINEAEGLLFTCEEELKLAREPFRPYTPKNEINVGYGIQLPPEFNPKMRSSFRKKCEGVRGSYFLFLSRIHPKKGVDILIDAYKKVKYENINISIPKLVIAGPGLNTAYGLKMQKLVEDSPDLKENVFFTGMLSGDDKWGAFYGCEAFILPSHQENFGIAVVEAMACSKPVLISNQINIYREIEAAKAGLVAADTKGGIRQLLEYWLTISDVEKWIMGRKAKELFSTKFSIEPAAIRLKEALIDIDNESIKTSKNLP